MIYAMRMNHSYSNEGTYNILLDKEPNIDANRFLKLLKEFDEPLLDECTTHSKLSTITWVFTIKLDYSLSGVGHGNVIE